MALGIFCCMAQAILGDSASSPLVSEVMARECNIMSIMIEEFEKHRILVGIYSPWH